MEKIFCSMCRGLNEHSIYPVQCQPEHIVVICACGSAEVIRNSQLDEKIREASLKKQIDSLEIAIGQIVILQLDQNYSLAMWNGDDFFSYPDADRILPVMIRSVSKLPKNSEFTKIKGV